MTKPNFPYTGIYDYLSQHELLEASPQKIRKAKERYKKLYQKHYQEWYRSRGKTLRIRVTNSEYRELTKLANLRETSPSEIVQIAIGKVLSKKVRIIGPRRELLRGLRRLQSEFINEVRVKLERDGSFSGSHQSISRRFSELEALIRKHFE